METGQDQERQEAWNRLCEETPAFSDIDTREGKLMLEVYKKDFKEIVDTGGLPYSDAIEQTRTAVDRRIAMEDIQAGRKELRAGKLGKIPQFNKTPTDTEIRQRRASW